MLEEPTPIEVTDPIAETVAAQIPNEDITPGVVTAVLEAYNAVKQGAPLGTVVLNPGNGQIALRFNDGGIHKWKVTSPDGSQWEDHQPTLAGWTVIREVTVDE